MQSVPGSPGGVDTVLARYSAPAASRGGADFRRRKAPELDEHVMNTTLSRIPAGSHMKEIRRGTKGDGG